MPEYDFYSSEYLNSYSFSSKLVVSKIIIFIQLFNIFIYF